MKRVVLFLLCAALPPFAFAATPGRTATEAYVTNKVGAAAAATLQAAKDYADGAISAAGSVTPEMVTNAAGAAATNAVTNIVTKSYVEGLGLAADVSLAPATNYTDSAIGEAVRTNYLCTVAAAAAMTNDVIRIITNDVPAVYSPWTFTGLPEGGTLDVISFDNVEIWYMSMRMENYPDDLWDGFAMNSEAYNPDATYLEFSLWSTIDPADRPQYQITATRTYTPPRHAFGFARLGDLAQAAESATNYTDAALAPYCTIDAARQMTNDVLVAASAGLAALVEGLQVTGEIHPLYSQSASSAVNADYAMRLGSDGSFRWHWDVFQQLDAATETNAALTAALQTVSNAAWFAAASARFVWDAEEEICYLRQMSGGFLQYIAVTNIDLTNPTNSAALKAWEDAQ